MPLFQLTTPLPVKLARLATPSRKKGGDIIHTTDIVVEFEGPNHVILPLFDPELLDQLYRELRAGEAPQQGDLAEVEVISGKPVLRSTSLKQPISLALEFTGYQMLLDRGLGIAGSNITSDEVTVKGIRIWVKEGGSTKGDMHLQGRNFSGPQVGQVRDMLKTASTLTLIAPKIQDELPGTQGKPQRGANGAPPAGDKPKGTAKPPKTSSAAAGRRKPDTASQATEAFLQQHGNAAH